MAISDSPEVVGTTAEIGGSGGYSVRRRLSASFKVDESEGLNKVSNGGNTADEVDGIVDDGGDNNDRINSETLFGSSSNGGVVRGSGGGESKVANGGGAQDFETAIKYVYRPSTPAHRKIKESPLSSDAIFKQVFIILSDNGIGLNFLVYEFNFVQDA